MRDRTPPRSRREKIRFTAGTAPISSRPASAFIYRMDFETIQDHSENASENNHGNRGQQARQFPVQG
ncbi:MAG: hypothetical protein ACRD9W_17980, partial [Terriglobia bacterium]